MKHGLLLFALPPTISQQLSLRVVDFARRRGPPSTASPFVRRCSSLRSKSVALLLLFAAFSSFVSQLVAVWLLSSSLLTTTTTTTMMMMIHHYRHSCFSILNRLSIFGLFASFEPLVSNDCRRCFDVVSSKTVIFYCCYYFCFCW
jgi:hypothetical protein